MGSWKKICKASDVPEGAVKAFEVEGEKVAVVNLLGKFYAISNVCTHAECELAGGPIAEGAITCMCHGSQFEVATGSVQTPPADKPLPTYAIKQEGDELLVEFA